MLSDAIIETCERNPETVAFLLLLNGVDVDIIQSTFAAKLPRLTGGRIPYWVAERDGALHPFCDKPAAVQFVGKGANAPLNVKGTICAFTLETFLRVFRVKAVPFGFGRV